MKRRLSFSVCFFIIALLLAASYIPSCDDNPTGGGGEYRVRIYSGNNQTERIGATLPEPLTVQVTTTLGTPRQGILVNLSTDAAGALVTPENDISDSEGLASCTLRLGTAAGPQYVKAKIEGDSTLFTATAEEPGCPEEYISRIGHWNSKHIYITTTSSSLLDRAGTVLIDFDPETKSIDHWILETTKTIIDLSFSPRGDLFLTSNAQVFKFDTLTHTLVSFATFPAAWNVELEPNPGGILTGLYPGGPFKVDCPPDNITPLTPGAILLFIREVNLTVDQNTRDFYVINGQNPPIFNLWRIIWDGRSIAPDAELHANVNGGAANPVGMCIDTTGTVYVTFNGTQNDRKIVSVSPAGEVDADFFDFFEYYGRNEIQAGQWGDIAYLDGRLYIIDTRNDRLVVISEDGDFIEEIESTWFSTQQSENERYGIAARPE